MNIYSAVYYYKYLYTKIYNYITFSLGWLYREFLYGVTVGNCNCIGQYGFVSFRVAEKSTFSFVIKHLLKSSIVKIARRF